MLPVFENTVAEGRLRAIIKRELIGNDTAAAKAVSQLPRALDLCQVSDRIMGYWVMAFLFTGLAGFGDWTWGGAWPELR